MRRYVATDLRRMKSLRVTLNFEKITHKTPDLRKKLMSGMRDSPIEAHPHMQTFFKILLYLLLATFTLHFIGSSLLGMCLLSGTCVPYLEYTFFAGSATFMATCFVLLIGAIFGIM